MKWVWRSLAIIFAIFVLALILLRVPDTDPTEMLAKYGGEPSQFVELDDRLAVHLRDEGPRDAQAIILLHGSNADLHTWQAWTELLDNQFRIIRIDQIGHGLTGPSKDRDYSLDAFVADVDELADKLGLESFVLAGNSMGGWIAMGYALEHPERVDGVVLIDASGAPIQRESNGNMGFAIASIPGANSLMASVLPRWLVKRSLSQSVSNKDIVTPEAVDRYWELARYPGNRVATLDRFGTERRKFTAGEMAGLNIPVLVMWGEEDPLAPYEEAGWYMEHLPNSTLASYPEIGHLPHEEAPARSAADLNAWLATLPLNNEGG